MLLLLGLLELVLVPVFVSVDVLLLPDSVVAVVEETVLVVRPEDDVFDVAVVDVVLIDNKAVSLRIEVKDSVAVESFELTDSETEAILVLACDMTELADKISELAPERAVLALEAADDRSEDAAAPLVEMADSALLRTEDALVGFGMGIGTIVMSLDFISKAREVATEDSADMAEVALESISETLEVAEDAIAELSGRFC